MTCVGVNLSTQTEGPNGDTRFAVRAAIGDVNRNLLVTEMQPVTSLINRAQAGTRFSLVLIGVFAVIAGVLAGVGLYGILSTAVRQRTAEIGVRMAMGAERENIFQLIGAVASWLPARRAAALDPGRPCATNRLVPR